jgi:hypothetical protein
MIHFIIALRDRNDVLFYFGTICFVLALVFFMLTKTTGVQVHGVNAWFKPFKFAMSLGIYSWTMGWFCYYLSNFNITFFNWIVVALWSFEILYIAFQASKGQLSHYNVSSPVYSLLYGLMAIAASVVTVYTAYIGWLFFSSDFPSLPDYYVWSIRWGIFLFVIFSFQGFAMGSRLSHSVGAVNDNSNLFILGWSKTVGDLRVAHFIGMHALQVLPIVSYYLLKSTKLTFALAAMYAILAVFTLIQALQGKSVFPNAH